MIGYPTYIERTMDDACMVLPRRRSSTLLRAWIACIAIPAHVPVDAFSPLGRASPALALRTTHGHSSERRRCRNWGGRGGALSSPRGDGVGCGRRSQAATERRRRLSVVAATELRMGLEDAIFAAQSIGSSLADAVIPSSSVASSSSPSSVIESAKSLAVLYAAGLWTSFSPCSLGLLPITVSYISNAADERDDGNTVVPTLAFAAGLATAFTALGVSASALGGVFGGSGGGGGGGGVGGGGWSALALAAFASLVSVLMGLQLLELIRLPLPSLSFGLRRTALAFEGGGGRRGGGGGGRNGSLFDENGGLVLGTTTRAVVDDDDDGGGRSTTAEGEEDGGGERYDAASALVRIFLLGGTSALVASPCATPVLTSLLAYLASASTSSASAASGDVWRGAYWMLSYTLGYSTPLLAVGATGGQALANLRKARDDDDGGGGFNLSATLGQWVNPLTGGVLIAFGMNGLLVALLGDPSVSALAPIID